MGADPDDLLLVRGSGLSADDRVIYQAVVNTTRALAPPTSVPTSSTPTLGIADLVSTADTPYSLTVHLPDTLTKDNSYALWVIDSAGQWSRAPILINDARPLWITPDHVYQSATFASLPRVLKVVGQNLQAAPGATTQVRLMGQTAYTLTAALDKGADPTANPQIARYVAAVTLPSSMIPGTYSISVSRDGVSWINLSSQPPGDGIGGGTAAQTFQVLPDPTAAQQFPVENYGHCLADGVQDDTTCILAAIDAANRAGGGDVVFGPGTWTVTSANLYASSHMSLDARGHNGVVVCPNVNLVGSGVSSTTIQMNAATWAAESNGTPYTLPLITLVGPNDVDDIHFADTYVYGNSAAVHYDYVHLLQVGLASASKPPACVSGISDTRASNVAIFNNVFDKPYIALMAGAQPIDHLVIAHNVFGAYYRDVYLQGVRISDSIIDFNKFEPSSFVQPGYPYVNAKGQTAFVHGQGVIASEDNSSVRGDFSENIADGSTSATRYLYSASDPTGWRAAFFFDLDHDNEMTLVSQNTATCTGDKAGDGESFSYDNNRNDYEFSAPEVVSAIRSDLQSSPSTTTLVVNVSPGTLTNPATNYAGYWLQMVKGDGVGQVRKIVGTTISGDHRSVEIVVSPALDVLPITTAAGSSNSLVTVGKQYWQVYTVDNFVDNRMPLCTKANADWIGSNSQLMPRSIGQMNYYGQTAESVFDGNEQHDSNGILLQHQAPYSFQAYNQIRNNTIDGEFQWSGDCSWAGIQLSLVGDSSDNSAPVAAYGTTISGNTITQSDGLGGGAIDLVQTGLVGAYQNAPWKLEDNALVFHNRIAESQDGATGPAECVTYTGRPAIAINSYATGAVAWHSVLYDNGFSALTPMAVNDLGTGTVRYCPTGAANSVECRGLNSVDVGVAATSNAPSSVTSGSQLTYNVSITNHDPGSASGDVTLTWEASAGITVKRASSKCSTDQGVCLLGILPAMTTATVTVTATVDSPGTWPMVFSVTHVEPDNVVSNNSATVTETVIN